MRKIWATWRASQENPWIPKFIGPLPPLERGFFLCLTTLYCHPHQEAVNERSKWIRSCSQIANFTRKSPSSYALSTLNCIISCSVWSILRNRPTIPFVIILTFYSIDTIGFNQLDLLRRIMIRVVVFFNLRNASLITWSNGTIIPSRL